MTSLPLWIRLLYGMLIDIYACFRIAALPTFRAVRKEPLLLVKPRELSRMFMSFVWIPFGDGVDEAAREEKERLVTPWASGVVVDIGAGYGHLLKYLDRTRVTAYIAVEPNVNMHERLRRKAREFGFGVDADADNDASNDKDEDRGRGEGRFLLIPYGVEEVDKIGEMIEGWARKWGRSGRDGEDGSGGRGRVVDTIISILTLCSVPARPSLSTSSTGASRNSESESIASPSTPPADTIRALQTRILRPGGQLLFYEHVRSPIPAFAQVQDILAPIWKTFFDGCVIGVDTVRAIWEAGFESEWGDINIIPGDEEEELNWRIKKGYTAAYDEWIEEGGVRIWKNRKVEDGGWAEMYTWGKKGEVSESLFFHQSGRCVKR